MQSRRDGETLEFRTDIEPFLHHALEWIEEQIEYVKNNRLESLAVTISVIGGLLVPHVDLLTRGIGFVLWGISNPLWIYYGLTTGKKGIAFLFTIYWIENISGIWNSLSPLFIGG